MSITFLVSIRWTASAADLAGAKFLASEARFC
jgi:hypothetical protein